MYACLDRVATLRLRRPSSGIMDLPLASQLGRSRYNEVFYNHNENIGKFVVLGKHMTTNSTDTSARREWRRQTRRVGVEAPD